MRKVAIDGTVMDVPDCEAHQHFDRSSGSRGEGLFPRVRKVSLVELGTHTEFAFVYGGWADAEKKSMVFTLIKVFADSSFLAKIYRSNWYRENDRDGIVVRIIEYKLDDPQRTGHDEVHRLIERYCV